MQRRELDTETRMKNEQHVMIWQLLKGCTLKSRITKADSHLRKLRRGKEVFTEESPVYGPTDTLSSDLQIQYFKIIDFCYYK